MKTQTYDKMDKIISLAKRRGFVFPGSEIYGGLANSWDFGPLGVELKNNIRAEWWRWFVERRADMVGIDAAIVMNPKVWEASGHLKEFSDPLVECKKCHERFREDQLGEAKCPSCESKEFMPARQFNLLFKTFIGPVEDDSAQAYLRGELAQAMFVDFTRVQESMRKQLPFGIASQGKVFRNEITPGNFIFRTREFELMEFEYFVRRKDWEKWFGYWQEQMHAWLAHLGIAQTRIHEKEIEASERAHYSQRTIDFEYDFPFGRKELYGLAYRTDFDLKNHEEKSGESLHYTDPDTGEKFLPHVIEPTFGLDRSVLAALCDAYHEDEAPTAEEGETAARVFLKFPYWMAPVKAAVFPLVKNKPDVVKKAQEVFQMLLLNFAAQYDEQGAIGRRYRRQDEIGTPFCVTIDFQTLEDETVTLRSRDSMEQIRIKAEDLTSHISQQISQS